MANSDGNQRSLEVIERETERNRKAFQLRCQGKDYYTIAEELDLVSPKSAERLVANYLENHVPSENLDMVRIMELGRLDELFTSWFERALNGHARGAEIVLAIMDRRSKYFGLDAPLKVDIEARVRAISIEMGLEYEDVMKEIQEAKKQLEGR